VDLGCYILHKQLTAAFLENKNNSISFIKKSLDCLQWFKFKI